MISGCLKDQWQSLEGLGGVALSRGHINKAAEWYQKAVGVCASVGANSQEQNRLVTKLSAALKLIRPAGKIYNSW